MGQISLSGTIVAGPPCGGCCDGFGGTATTIPLSLSTTPKNFGAATGTIQQQVNVASPSFGVLHGVGAGETVTKADVLAFKTASPLVLRLTTDDGSGGDVVAVVPVQGSIVWEFPTNLFLKKLEVQGSGQIEYFLSGQI